MDPVTESQDEKVPLKSNTIVLPNVQSSRTICGTIRYVISNITVEPVLAIFMMSTYIAKLAIQNLNIEKVCRVTKKYGDKICDSLIERNENTTEYEAGIQKVISEIEAWKGIIATVLPIITIIYLGAWSDRTGNRRICILIPIVGEVLVNMSNILSTFFFDAVSAEVTMLMEALLPGITGGFWLMLIGIFSYIIDITTVENRTFRVGLVTISVVISMPTGMALSGIFLKLTGYYGVFFITTFLNLSTFLYGYKTVKIKTITDRKKSISISDVILLQKETALVVFQKRSGNTRSKIIIVLLIVSVVFGQDTGEQIIFYLFSRYRLNWDVYKYGIFNTYGCIVNAVGSLFSLFVFTKWLRWSDSSISLVAVFSKAVSSILTVFVQTDWQMFLVPLVAILNSTKYAAVRSLGSKLVPTTDAGKMNSLISLMETLGGSVFNPAYTLLYAATMEHFTGAVFIFTALTTVPVLIMLLWLFREHRREFKVDIPQPNEHNEEIL